MEYLKKVEYTIKEFDAKNKNHFKSLACLYNKLKFGWF